MCLVQQEEAVLLKLAQKSKTKQDVCSVFAQLLSTFVIEAFSTNTTADSPFPTSCRRRRKGA